MKIVSCRALSTAQLSEVGLLGLRTLPMLHITDVYRGRGNIIVGGFRQYRWDTTSKGWVTWLSWGGLPYEAKGGWFQLVWGCPPTGGDLDVWNHVRDGKKIQAIKAARAIYGMGLKEAKEYVEQNYY